MNWYYANNNEQKGPVTQTEFDQLAQQGVITASTLVWQEGMAEWQAYGRLGMATPPPPPVAGVAGERLPCNDCNQLFSPDELVQIGGRSICAKCKPLALQRLREGIVNTDANAEIIRKAHLTHEASIKSVGSLYLLAAIFMTIGTAGLFIALVAGGSSSGASTGEAIGQLAVFVPLTLLMFWVSSGLKQLKPSARIASGIMAGLGLLGFPLGTLINGYILYLLFSAKGKTVFSAEYKAVIEATPHIKYRTSILVWIVLGIIVLLLVLGVGMVLFSGIRR